MKNRTHRVVRVTGGRVALMNTSPVPDAEIVKAIRMIAKELDPGVVDRVIVHVKNDTGMAATLGYAYQWLPYETNTNGLKRHEWRHLVIVRASGRSSYWVDTLAHEFKHVEAYKLGHYRHLRKTRNSERRCRAFGHGMWKKWKETNAQPDVADRVIYRPTGEAAPA